MSVDPSEVLVFRTNVRTPQDIHRLRPVLHQLAGNTGKWNFDLGDGDAILRVDMPGLTPDMIIWRLRDNGFHCQELEDIVYPPRMHPDYALASNGKIAASHPASSG